MDEPRRLAATPMTGGACEHAEGPVWDARDRVLRYVDLMRGDVMTFDPYAASLTRTHVADVVAALRPRQRGGWVLAVERGFALTEPGSWTIGPVIEAFPDRDVRMNDGGCDAGGGFLCGSMAYDKRPGAASLYRLAPNGTVRAVLTGATISNGFCLDPTGTRAYYADTPTGRVDVFDVGPDGWALTNRRPFVAFEAGAGWPDGLTVDAEGGVWVALYGGAAVRAYGPDGRLEVVIEVATPHVTSCAFGGDDLRDLFITTTQEGLDPAVDRLAGALFHAVPGVAGLAPRPFAG